MSDITSLENEISLVTQKQAEALKKYIEHDFLKMIGSALVYLNGISDEPVDLSEFSEKQREYLESFQNENENTDEEVMSNTAAVLEQENLASTELFENLKSEMNKLSSKKVKEKIENLMAENPLLANVMAENLFVFEDLILLSGRDIFKIARKINQEDLAIALKGASAELQDCFFKCYTKHAATILKEDMEFMGPQPPELILEKQEEIVKIAQDLIKKGKILF